MKRRKNENSGLNQTFAESARRDLEIAIHGKMVSLRPSVAFKSKKIYDRKREKRNMFIDA